LPIAIAFQHFETIARWHPQVIHTYSRLDHL